MNDSTIARNYAETLLVLAQRAKDVEGWGTLMEEIGSAVAGDPRLRNFLESPKVAAAQKSDVLGEAYANRAPRVFLLFLQTLVVKRRQMLIPQIATEYRRLIDESEDRVHANVTVAREPAPGDSEALTKQLSRLFGKKVVAHVTLNPAILGGVIVKVGDTVMDGSVRRRLATLRTRMMASGTLPRR